MFHTFDIVIEPSYLPSGNIFQPYYALFNNKDPPIIEQVFYNASH